MIHWHRNTGRRQEFEKEALRHFNSLYNTAVRLTQSAWEAEDLIQETYMKAYASFHRFEKGTHCKAWLMKIMLNTYINLYRREKRQTQAAESGMLEDLYLFNRFEESLPAFGEVMGEQFLSSLVSDDVKKAIDQLPDDFRAVILLADVESFSYQETADILGCSLGTVKSRLFRGRQLLQKSLWEYAAERGIVRR